MSQVAVRLPDNLIRAVDDAAGRLHRTRSELIRRALELYVHRLTSEHDAAVYDQLPVTNMFFITRIETRAHDAVTLIWGTSLPLVARSLQCAEAFVSHLHCRDGVV